MITCRLSALLFTLFLFISLKSSTTFASLTPTCSSKPASRKRRRSEDLALFKAKKKHKYVKGTTPLHDAARDGHLMSIKALIEKGAPVDEVDNNGLTPLHLAALHRRVSAVDRLIKAGASQNVINNDGLTPLHMAAQKGNGVIIELLLKAGAHFKQTDRAGHTPLAHALHSHTQNNDRQEVIQLLLLIERDNAPHFSVETQSLLEEQHFDSARFEINFEKSKKLTHIHGQALTGVLEHHGMPKVIAQLIFEYYRCVDTRINLFKLTKQSLHAAAGNGYREVVELLLNDGDDADAHNEAGSTPLHCAIEQGREEVVEILLRAGAHEDVVNKQNETPLAQALRMYKQGEFAQGLHQSIINLLLLIDKGDASSFSSKTQGFLKEQHFDPSAFEIKLEKSKKLLKDHTRTLITLLENHDIPTVIASLILEYHTCADTRINFFKKATLSSSTD